MLGPASSVIPDDAQPHERRRGATLDEFQNDVTAFIETHATKFFIGLAIYFLLSFNGQWRIGMDSANYRGLADSLANGRGYTFGDWAPHNVYPGFPVLLAGLQMLFGRSAVVPCMAMLAMGATTLLISYRLMRLHFPKWIAVTVTFGLGTNACFLQQSSELMTDVPFALGVVLALYGWDRLRLALQLPPPRIGACARATLLLVIGLAIAAVMRPTFLVLVAAWAIACLIGMLIGPQRKFYALVLIVILAVWSAAVSLDPRSHGFHPLSGGYEREATELLTTADASRVQQLLYVLNDQLPAGFFGEQLALGSIHVNGKKYSPTSIAGSLLIIGAPLLLLRRHPLWTLLAWGTVGATIVYAAEPRYYLMAMPILLVGWLTLIVTIARRLPKPWSQVVLIAGLSLVTLNNLSASVSFFREQRSFSFLEHYRKGKWLAAVHMADLISKNVPSGDTVIGPSGSVMSYLSGRHVYTQRELFKPHEKVEHFPAVLASKGIRYAIFPAPLYRDKEPAMSRLMDRGVLRLVHRIAEIDGLRLCTLRVVVPNGDWQHQPKLYGAAAKYVKPPPKKHKRAATTRPVRKKKKKPAATISATSPS